MVNNISKFQFYLIQPIGRLVKPIDLDPRRVHKVIKVNNQFLKFGKLEKKSEIRLSEYIKIFGKNIRFESICSFRNKKELDNFKKHITEIFDNYRVSNPKSKKKLDWMMGISFARAKKIINQEYNSMYQNSGLNSLIGELRVLEFCKIYDLTINDLIDLIKKRKKPTGRPGGKRNKHTEIVQEYLSRTTKYFLKKNPKLSNSQIADEILKILRSISEEKISNEVLIYIRRLSKERLRKLISK